MINLEESRKKIDEIDQQLFMLFCERMKIVIDVAAYKIEHHLPILNQERENEIIQKNVKKAPDELKIFVQKFFEHTMELSRSYQKNLMDNNTKREQF